MNRLIFFLLFFLLPTPLFAFSFADQLYQEKDYYRAITEAKRELKNAKSQRKSRQLLLAKSHYQLGEFTRSQLAIEELLTTETNHLEANQLKGLNLIQLKKLDQVKAHYSQLNPAKNWPELPTKNVALAKNMSYVLPGSGLLYAGSPWKALGSFGLNAIFIKAVANSLASGNHATALLLFTFEMGWYFGGAKAAAEEAEKFNLTQVKNVQLELFQVDF